jgi:hypothetical protein
MFGCTGTAAQDGTGAAPFPQLRVVALTARAGRAMRAYRVKRDGSPRHKSSLAKERTCLSVCSRHAGGMVGLARCDRFPSVTGGIGFADAQSVNRGDAVVRRSDPSDLLQWLGAILLASIVQLSADTRSHGSGAFQEDGQD